MRCLITVARELEQKRRCLFIGEPIVHFSAANLRQLAKSENLHYEHLLDEGLPTAKSLGRFLGFIETTTSDLVGTPDLRIDLHNPLPIELIEKFDLVIDGGVLFWCFDPAFAIKNMYRLLSRRGRIVHITALSGFYGRGYYNIHPRMLLEFYKSNGCRFLLGTSRPRKRISRFFRKIYRNKIHKFSETGWHLVAASARYLSFGESTIAPREPTVIPTNVIGCFAFEKIHVGEPVIPRLVELNAPKK
jgi:SAM-dependent methyltransferase